MNSVVKQINFVVNAINEVADNSFRLMLIKIEVQKLSRINGTLQVTFNL